LTENRISPSGRLHNKGS